MTVKKQKRDLYQEITDSIVEALEAGATPWVKEWGDGLPRNLETQRVYRGVNALLLAHAAQRKGFGSQEWLTYKQAQEAGGQVRKGEKGTLVILYKMIEKEAETPDGEKEQIPLIRSFTVFNREQIEGLPELDQPEAIADHEEAEKTLAGSGATIRHGGNEAFYDAAADQITLPPKGAFSSAAGYYATAFHELTHWTGASGRLNRPRVNRQHPEHSGSLPERAFEELVAELGAAMLCGHHRIEGDLRHAGYIESWLQALKGDKRYVFRAATEAQKAVDFVLKAEADEIDNAA